jgi:hypothetical protein
MYGLQNSPAFQKVNEVNKTEKVTFVQFSKKKGAIRLAGKLRYTQKSVKIFIKYVRVKKLSDLKI